MKYAEPAVDRDGRKYMIRVSKYRLWALAAACLSLPATAAEVHKWVDADGVTHYADAPPAAADTTVTRIDVKVEPSTTGKDNYYSIANQWARVHRERLQRERIALENARLEAARQAQRTEVVHVEKPAAENRYAVKLFPGRRYRRADHRGPHYRFGRHRGHAHYLKYRTEPTRNGDPGFYKHVQ